MVRVAPVQVEQVDPAAGAGHAAEVQCREPCAARGEVLGEPEPLEDLHRARVDDQRLGEGGPSLAALDHADGESAAARLDGGGQAGGACADHQQV